MHPSCSLLLRFSSSESGSFLTGNGVGVRSLIAMCSIIDCALVIVDAGDDEFGGGEMDLLGSLGIFTAILWLIKFYAISFSINNIVYSHLAFITWLAISNQTLSGL